MLGILKKLFDSSSLPEPVDDALAALARDRRRADDFVTHLAQASIWIIALGQNSAMPPDEFSEEALHAHIERNAGELSELSEGDNIVPYIFQRGASPILPFFSSMEFAEHFIRTERWDTVVALQVLQLHSGFLASPQLDDCLLILNPNSKSERTLTAREQESFHQQATRC